jgi:hypothetical protein
MTRLVALAFAAFTSASFLISGASAQVDPHRPLKVAGAAGPC